MKNRSGINDWERERARRFLEHKNEPKMSIDAQPDGTVNLLRPLIYQEQLTSQLRWSKEGVLQQAWQVYRKNFGGIEWRDVPYEEEQK